MGPASTPRPPGTARGIAYAVAAAVTFGVSTPLARLLLGTTHPALLAALLYLGAGSGLGAAWLVRHAPGAGIRRRDAPWLAGSALVGGVAGPLALLVGLRATPAGAAALLLNLEGVFTALIAWRVFGEHIDRRLAVGMALVVAGCGLLAWPGSLGAGAATWWGPVAVVLACLAWAVDNNLTRKVADADPRAVVAVKGLVAGAINLLVALAVGARWPGAAAAAAGALLGLVSYGASLLLFVLALRHLGAARTGSWFALAPFVGAATALVVLHERPAPALLPAAALMAVGLYLHATERHAHAHAHEPEVHAHAHRHDDGHHAHDHPPGVAAIEGHSHDHAHPRVVHGHAHYPDTHHRHDHAK